MDTLLLVLAGLNLSGALAFIAVFSREPWRNHTFGQSAMTLAVAVALFSLLGVLRYTLGEHYPARDWLIVAGRVLVFVAIAQRLFVLRRDRRVDR